MALFGRKDTGEKKPEAVVVPAPAARVSAVGVGVAHVLRHARITEKATMHSGTSVYTFDVEERATKRDIAAAVRALYKVSPMKIAVVTIPSKVRRNMRTGKIGTKKGGKKAYVYLKKGETISIS